MASDVIDLGKGLVVPPHPPPPGPERERWSGWAAWDQYCRLHQQHTRLTDLNQFIIPSMNYYYDLDEEHLGSIRLPNFVFPEPLNLNNYSYDGVHRYLEDAYGIVLGIALPRTLDGSSGHGTRQTTLGRYIQPYKSLQVSDSHSIIRLLVILPSNDESAPVSTRLFTADLDANGRPAYEALSYTWGEKSGDGQSYYINVNGYKKAVTPNLHSALSSLRHPRQSKTIWVDSICINQADVEERGQQVLLMARIYAEASRVLVHLGASTPLSATFFEMLQHLADNNFDCSRKEEDHDHDDDENHDGKTDPKFWKLCHDAGPDLVEGFIEFCTRSWWTRIWVLQEYTLNKRDPIFYCGRLNVPNAVLSKHFGRLYEWVEHRKRHHIPLLDDCRHPACNQVSTPDRNVGEVSTREAQGKGEGEQVTREETMPKDQDPKDARQMIREQGSRAREWSAWGRRVWRANYMMLRRNYCSPSLLPFFSTLGLQGQCTIPHDAVYGMRELMDPLFRSLFPPNYGMPLSMLFARFAVYLLIVDMNLDVFWHFPYRLRDRALEGDPQFKTRSDVVVPSWVPDFTRPRAERQGEGIPSPYKLKPERWDLAPHIFDRVLFMNGMLLDEIIEVFPLSNHDPFLLLQQLWYVERSYMNPGYLHRDHNQRKANFDEMVKLLGGLAAHPSIAWATDDKNRNKMNVSIVEIIEELTNLSPLLLESVERYVDKIPDVVDAIIRKEQENDDESAGQAEVDQERSAGDHTSDIAQAFGALDLTMVDSGGLLKLDRKGRIREMKQRFHQLRKFLVEDPTWADFVGICTFDYDNFRAQVLHRLCVMSAQRAADIFGDMPGYEHLKKGLGPRHRTSECGAMHTPVSYEDYIKEIESGACHPLEVHIREGFVIDLATKIHEVMADMVGLQGDKDFRAMNSHVPFEEEKEMEEAEESRRIISMVPLPWIGVLVGEEWHGKDRAINTRDLSTLALPHCEKDHPFGPLSRWRQPSRKIKYDVHTTLECVVDLLVGREFFLTETGLVGLAGVGVNGVQDGDDLFILEGMSYLLIARLEPSLKLGTPKKRRREMSTRGMRREIVGTAVVKDIDPKGGKVEAFMVPSWFEPITGSAGRYRFF